MIIARKLPASSSLKRGVGVRDREAEAGGEVLLVADHDVDVAARAARLTSRARRVAADRLPQAGPVVEVVGHDGAVPAGGAHRLLERRPAVVSDRRGEDAAGVEPAHAQLAEQVGPSRRRRLELASGGVPAVGDADRAADAEAALGEVQAVADRRGRCRRTAPSGSSDGVDAALEDQVLDQPADLVVGEAR